MIVWIWTSIVVLILVLLGVFVFVSKEKKPETDYHSLFVMGVIWIGAGIPLMISANSPTLFFMGIVFMIIGLSNRKKWKQNIQEKKKRWKGLSKKDKKRFIWFRWFMFSILLIGVLALGLVVYFSWKV